MRIWYIDTTLRDGEQAPGVSFSHEEKMNIASLLDDLEIDEVEVGTPIIGPSEINIMRDIANAGFNFATTAWCRATHQDIKAALNAETDGINISFPVSKHHLDAMGKNKGWLIATLPKMANMANDFFEYTAIGLQDATRAEYSFLRDFIGYATLFGDFRFRIADTVGCMNPYSTSELFIKLCHDFPGTDFEFHAHNDLGMATANSFSAVMSGATSLSTTINGLGERAGNTPLDEIVMALKYSSKTDTHINLKKIQEISNYVSRASGREIPASKPITGRKVFQHESGIHTKSLLKNKTSYQFIDESETGRANGMEIVYGKHSGTGAVRQFYAERGLNLQQNTLSSILEQIRFQAGLKKDNLKEDELMNIYYQLT